MLLTQAALGPLRRFFPGRAALRFAWALAGQPGLVASRAGGLTAELARVAGAPRASPRPSGTGGSPTPRGRATRCCAGSCRPTWRPGTRRSASSTTSPLDWRDAERLRFAMSNLVDALAPSNSRAVTGGVEGGAQLRWRQPADRGQAPAERPRQRAARARHGAARRLHGRHRPGGDPGRGRAAHPVVRADPVPARDRDRPRAPGADRPADDQQVLRPRPRPRPEPGRVPGQPGAASVRHVLAQPGRATRLLGVRRVHVRHHRGGRHRGGHLRRRGRAPARRLLRRHPRQPRRRGADRRGRARGAAAAREPRAAGHHARPVAHRRRRRARGRAHGGGGDRRLRQEGLPGRAQARRGLRLAAAAAT